MMAKAEEMKDQTASSKEETPSMEEILQSIRGVISGDETAEEDVLELTDMVEDAAATVAEKEAVAPEAVAQEKSILDDIDDALDDGSAKKAEEGTLAQDAASAEPIAAEEVKTEEVAQEAKVEEVAPEAVPEPAIEATVNDSQTSSEADMTNEIPAEDILEAEPHVENAMAEVDVSAALTGDRLLDEEVAKQSSGALKQLVNSVPEKHVHSPSTRSGTSLEELVIEAMKPFLADWLNKNLPAIVKKIVEKEVKRLIPKEEDD